jgi:hypothetical protein
MMKYSPESVWELLLSTSIKYTTVSTRLLAKCRIIDILVSAYQGLTRIEFIVIILEFIKKIIH